MSRSPTYLIAPGYILPLLIFFPVWIATPSYAGQPLRLADADRAQILKSVLCREIGKAKRSEVEAILLLNNEKIKQDWLLSIPHIEITLINADEVKARLAAANEFSYYFFSKLEIQGSKVIVEFGKCDEGKRISSSSGTIYQYRKVSGKWRGEPTGGFGSCAASDKKTKRTLASNETSNKGLQRRPRSKFLTMPSLPFAARLNAGG